MARMRSNGRKVKAEPIPPSISRGVLTRLAILAALPAAYILIGNFYLVATTGAYPLHDGATIWIAGRLVLAGQGAMLFDPPALAAWAAAHGQSAAFIWSYPPSTALFTVPFGFFSPAVAVLLFDALSLGALAAALRVAGCGRSMLLAVLLSPAALQNFGGNQSGALAAALLISGLFLAEDRPIAAGVLLGLAIIKPQLGILAPFYLLGRSNFRVIAAATLTAAALAAASLVLFSPQAWFGYITRNGRLMTGFLINLTAPGHGAPAIMSVFALCREAGAGVRAGFLIQAVATLAAAAVAFALGREKSLDRPTGIALLLILGTLATPYIWYYDMIPAALGTAILIRNGSITRFLPVEFFILALFWATPGLAIIASLSHVPTIAPLLAACILVAAARRHFLAADNWPPAPDPAKPSG